MHLLAISLFLWQGNRVLEVFMVFVVVSVRIQKWIKPINLRRRVTSGFSAKLTGWIIIVMECRVSLLLEKKLTKR